MLKRSREFCADCVGNRIINDIPSFKRKELGDFISKWVSYLVNNMDEVHCRMSAGWINLLRGVPVHYLWGSAY